MKPTFALALALAAAPALAQENDQAAGPTDVSLTVYSNADPRQFDPQQFIAQQRQGYDPQFVSQVPGFGVVRDTRTLDLEEGLNTVRYRDVAQFIDPTTVSLVPLDEGPEIEVLQQEFEFDLVSPEKLLDKYIDQEVTVNVEMADQVQSITGTLLSSSQGRLVLQTDEGVQIVPWSDHIQLGELPGGLITQPTLVWELLAGQAGQRQVRTAYQTDGITWRADYNLVLGEEETTADLGAWVTLLNLSGARYQDAQLKLIAGDVQRVEPPQPVAYDYAVREAAMAQRQRGQVGFEEKSFFEYHLYTLPRPVTIEQNSTMQIALFPTAQDVNVTKKLVYYGLPEHFDRGFFPNPRTDRELGVQSNEKVDVYIEFANEEENNLGIPLPAGLVRVYKEDPDDQALEFVGEDLIDHTPKGQEVLVKVGQAFDVTGERVQTNFRVDADDEWMEETITVTLHNAKEQPQDVTIRENLYRWVNWEIIDASDEWEKLDSRTIHFPVTVPAEGEKAVTYTVRYTW